MSKKFGSPVRALLYVSLIATSMAVGTACKSDNSADTEQAAKDVRKAQEEFNAQTKVVGKQTVDVAREQRVLDRQDQKLDAITTDFAKARAAYVTAIRFRFGKLDTGLAELATKTDAKAKDAYTGLHARRDQLSTKLDNMTAASDTGWSTYTKDLDTTFDAMEHDLSGALN
ncbi:hypothetical protein BH11MYX1_BH11MYX1_10000 [soil metagenome]